MLFSGQSGGGVPDLRGMEKNLPIVKYAYFGNWERCWELRNVSKFFENILSIHYTLLQGLLTDLYQDKLIQNNYNATPIWVPGFCCVHTKEVMVMWRLPMIAAGEGLSENSWNNNEHFN